METQGKLCRFLIGRTGSLILRQLIGKSGIINEALLHLGKGGEYRLAVALHAALVVQFRLPDRLVERGAIQKRLAGRGSQIPGAIGPEVREISTRAGGGTPGKRDFREQVGHAHADASGGSMQIVLRLDYIRAAAQQLTRQTCGYGRHQIVDALRGQLEGYIVHGGAKQCGE